MRTLIVCLFGCVLIGCQRVPAPQAAQPEQQQMPLIVQERPGEDIKIGFKEDPVLPPVEHAPALAPIDELPRLLFHSMDEGHLRRQFLTIGTEQIKKPDEPEWYIRKGMVAEALTRYDGQRGTNHWSRAMTHYSEAIERLQRLVGGNQTDFAKKRLAEVSYYRSRCYLKLGKEAEAKADREVALGHSQVAAAIADYENEKK